MEFIDLTVRWYDMRLKEGAGLRLSPLCEEAVLTKSGICPILRWRERLCIISSAAAAEEGGGGGVQCRLLWIIFGTHPLNVNHCNCNNFWGIAYGNKQKKCKKVITLFQKKNIANTAEVKCWRWWCHCSKAGVGSPQQRGLEGLSPFRLSLQSNHPDDATPDPLLQIEPSICQACKSPVQC